STSPPRSWRSCRALERSPPRRSSRPRGRPRRACLRAMRTKTRASKRKPRPRPPKRRASGSRQSTMGKIRVEELAAQMGIGSKEVLFLLQSIGVDVKSPQAALDEATVMAILQGKTHAPKQLIVRDTESRAFRPQKSALSRIKIIDKAPAAALA